MSILSEQEEGLRSSEWRVVIPSNSSRSGYFRNWYYVNGSAILNPFIDKEAFDKIVKECSHILSSNYSLKW